MSISTYSELKQAVASWLHRTDLGTRIPDFIRLAEARMSADIDARPMETRATLTATAGDAWVTLPSDMLEMRRLIVATDPVRPLKYATPDQLSSDYPMAFAGQPAVFAVIGSELQLAPIPDADYSLELTYLQRIPALSDSDPTNWLLTAFPNAYLYGALAAAHPYLIDDERLPVFQTLYAEAVGGINKIDWYSGTTMRVRAR